MLEIKNIKGYYMNDYNNDIEYTLFIEERKRIKELIIIHGYKEYFSYIMLLYNTYFKFSKIEDNTQESELEQIAGLILFLQKSFCNKISLKSTISIPEEGEIKNQSLNFVLNNINLTSNLINYLHSYLTEKRGGRYYLPIGNNNEDKSLNYLSYFRITPEGEYIPYSNKELNEIFKQEAKASKNRKLGELSNLIFESFVRKGIFESQPTIKAYCFIYDFLSLIEGINLEEYELYTYSGDEAKCKYDKVRYWIKAYKAKE